MSWCRGHANLLDIVPIVVYVLPKWEHFLRFVVGFGSHLGIINDPSDVEDWTEEMESMAGMNANSVYGNSGCEPAATWSLEH